MKNKKILTITIMSSILAIIAGVEYSAINTKNIHAKEIASIEQREVVPDTNIVDKYELEKELRNEEILTEKYLIENIPPISVKEARKAVPAGVKYADKKVSVYTGPNELEEKIGEIDEGTAITFYEVLSNGWLYMLYEDDFGYVNGEELRDTKKKPLPPKPAKKSVNKTVSKPVSGKEMTFRLSFYTNISGENGKYTTTASGKTPAYGMVASNIYPFGTRIYLEGYGEMVVEDRGGSHFNSSDRIDVFIQRKDGESNADYRARAMKLGRQTVKGYIID